MKILDIPRSGSYQAICSSRNRAGQYVRNRVAPAQPVGTGRRAFIRSALASASSGFASLTAAQIAAWNSFADLHPATDRLGQTIRLTGHQWYVACAVQRVNTGRSVPSAPPASMVTLSVAGASATVTLASGVNIVLPATGGASDFVLVGLSQQVSLARNYWRTFWQAKYQVAIISSVSVSRAAYEAQFGTLAIGKKVFVRVTPVNAGGVTGVPVILGVPVTA